MTDLYLQAVMKGALAKRKMSSALDEEKNPVQIAIENKIDAYLDTLDFSNDDKLQSGEQKRARLKEEMLIELQENNASAYVQSALALLENEAKNYLEASEIGVLLEEFANIEDKVKALEPEAELTANFQALLNISDNSMSVIFKMATAKFMASQYVDCLALFMLLTALNDSHSEYWLRAGIAAQECNDLRLALRAYNRALALNNNLIDARLFAIECCLACDRIAEAQMHYHKAKEIADSVEVELEYRDLLTVIKSNYHHILG